MWRHTCNMPFVCQHWATILVACCCGLRLDSSKAAWSSWVWHLWSTLQQLDLCRLHEIMWWPACQVFDTCAQGHYIGSATGCRRQAALSTQLPNQMLWSFIIIFLYRSLFYGQIKKINMGAFRVMHFRIKLPFLLSKYLNTWNAHAALQRLRKFFW